MTHTPSATPDRLVTRRRYRRLMYGSMTAGVLGFVLAVQLEYPLVGVAAYWLGFVGFLAVWKGTSIELQDERDCALERRAASLTLSAFGLVLTLGWPAVFALAQVGRLTPPPEYSGALWAFVAVYGVFGVVYVVLRFRR